MNADNIDSLLVDMIELGLSEPRVNIIVSAYSNIDYFPPVDTETNELYRITFPSLDKTIGNIEQNKILDSLMNGNYKVTNLVNPSTEYIIGININQALLRIAPEDNNPLKIFIQNLSHYYKSQIVVELSIDNKHIYGNGY